MIGNKSLLIVTEIKFRIYNNLITKTRISINNVNTMLPRPIKIKKICFSCIFTIKCSYILIITRREGDSRRNGYILSYGRKSEFVLPLPYNSLRVAIAIIPQVLNKYSL